MSVFFFHPLSYSSWHNLPIAELNTLVIKVSTRLDEITLFICQSRAFAQFIDLSSFLLVLLTKSVPLQVTFRLKLTKHPSIPFSPSVLTFSPTGDGGRFRISLRIRITKRRRTKKAVSSTALLALFRD